MHDIGKIGIPDRILLKPGKLDHDEWAVEEAIAELTDKSGSIFDPRFVAEFKESLPEILLVKGKYLD
jgi:response regulator RpfG family c-di-GMP phosphodiesterase